MKKRPRRPTFREIAEQVQSEVPAGESLTMRPNPIREGAVVDDEVRIWTLRRRHALSFPKAMSLLPSVDAMMLDSFPFGERRIVPPDDRVAVLEAARDQWEAADCDPDFGPGDESYEAYKFEDDAGRVMLYLQHWYD